MIVGLVGFAGSGKDTIGELMVKNHGFFRESFAKSLKDAASIIFNWNRVLLEGETAESRNWREQDDEWWSAKLGRRMSPRLALQLLGTECGRGVFGQNLWTSSLVSRIDQKKNYVITDVRFPNEIDTIKSLGGKIVVVKRGIDPVWYDVAYECNTKNNPERMLKEFSGIHMSEWAWIGSGHDITFDNNCEIAQLPKRVDSLVDSLYNERVEEIVKPEIHNETVE
jgi:hypothetical protein